MQRTPFAFETGLRTNILFEAGSLINSLEEDVLEVIRNFHVEYGVPFSLEKPIYDFFGDDAEDLIFSCGRRIGLSEDVVGNNFPFRTYFLPESYVSSFPFLAVRDLFFRLVQPAKQRPVRKQLTALQLADILVSMKHAADRGELR